MSARNLSRAAAFATVLLAGPAAAVPAEPAPGQSRGFIEAGRLFFSQEPGSHQTWGFRYATVDPGGTGLDFGLGMLTSGGGVGLLADVDLSRPLALSRQVLLAPRGGLSVFLVAVGSFGAFAGGANAGLGLVLSPRRPVALRLDYTARKFFDRELDDEGLFQSVTLGVSWIAPK